MVVVDGDRIPIFTSEDGVPHAVSASDVRFAQESPNGVMITGERKRRYPDPADGRARALYAEIRERFNSGDAYLAVALCQDFTKAYGWFGPVALYEILAREAIGEPFTEHQDELVRALNEQPTGQLCELSEPIEPQHTEWLLGLILFNRAEDARIRGHFSDALHDMEGSFAGLTDDPLDDEARLRRLILVDYLRRKIGSETDISAVEKLRTKNPDLFDHVFTSLKLEIDDL